MESISEQTCDELYRELIVQYTTHTRLTYEHWEWEEGNMLVYQEGMRVRGLLEELLGVDIHLRIENGSEATEKVLHFTKDPTSERDVEYVKPPEPLLSTAI